MVNRLNAMVLTAALDLQDRAVQRLRRQEGQAFVEYSLVLILVAVAVALLAQWDTLRTAIVNALQRVVNALNSSGTG